MGGSVPRSEEEVGLVVCPLTLELRRVREGEREGGRGNSREEEVLVALVKEALRAADTSLPPLMALWDVN